MSEFAADAARIARRIRVALGQEPGDLLLTGGRVVDVFTRSTIGADVVVADGAIAGVGRFEWDASLKLDLAGRTVIPGLIDAHMHLESTLLTPAELARTILPRGTTAIVSDSHEIGNVLGVAGIDLLAKLAEGLPLDVFFMASSCVPATAFEDAGAALGIAQVRELLAKPRVLGLAEVMDVPAVLRGEAEVLAKVAASLASGQVVDGHAPSLDPRALMAYAAAGVRSDHESIGPEEALLKARLGMLVQVREGSPAQNLDALLPLLASGAIDDAWCLVTDDIFPDDLRRTGHLDALLRRVVAGGIRPEVAVRHASYVPARHYGLRDRGAVAPGFRADLVVVDDLADFRVDAVVKDGRLVVRDRIYVADHPTPTLGPVNTVRLPTLDEATFRLPLSGSTHPAIRVVPDQIVTRFETVAVDPADGSWRFDPARDLALIASIERHRASGKIGLGLVAGLGLDRPGALASTVAHDSHNLIVAGTDPRAMLHAARALAEVGGGFVATGPDGVLELLPLPLAGLIATLDAAKVADRLGAVNAAARALGCPLAAPFGTLSFLALPVIPELRITARGLFDVRTQEFL